MSFCVWCQGGRADGWRYETLIEPPDEITLYELPRRRGEWARVFAGDNWPNAVTYERVRSVEQIDGECIYYPKGIDD